jgi:hypothetical protein
MKWIRRALLVASLTTLSFAPYVVAEDCNAAGHTYCCICYGGAGSGGSCSQTFGGGYSAYFQCYTYEFGCGNGESGCSVSFCDPYYAPGC